MLFCMKTTIIIRFNGNTVTVTNQKDSENNIIIIPLIARVDYDTVMGNDLIYLAWHSSI